MTHHHNDTIQMIAIMLVASLMSTMNVWADKSSDWRLSLNDMYMATLMTGWMLVFMGCVSRSVGQVLTGGCIVASSLYCIRKQVGVTMRQYYSGMIPHHSMAVFVSRKALARSDVTPEDISFLNKVIRDQKDEIELMKARA
jgi:uncharacterized protein (DUF305 family)